MTSALRDTTIVSTVLDAAAQCPDRVAISCHGAELTYGQLVDHAQAFAGFLRSSGVGARDRVGLWLPNGLAWAVAHIATALAGGVTVPINTRLTAHEASYMMTHSDSRVIVAADTFLGRGYADEAREIVAQTSANPRPVVVATAWNAPGLPHAVPVRDSTAQPDDAAVVQYTSGTTGPSKGCILSHRAWTNNARLSAEIAGVAEGNPIITPSPFFHLFGSLTALMGAFSSKATLITTPTFDAEETVATIQKTGASHMVAVPTVWLDVLSTDKAHELTTLVGGVWGGGAFPNHALQSAVSPDGYGWDLNAIYGMTEAPTLTQVQPDDPLLAKTETVGRATPEVELRIVDPDSNEKVPAGETGEVRARGYNQMIGYLNDPEGTANRIVGGWIRTGDLGTLDEAGFLRIVGRITDMVVTGGANVYSSEVENVIASIPDVALVAVVARSDDRLGEVPVAFVTTRPASLISEQDVIDFCRTRLAGYKVPHAITFLPQMPLTASGKIEKVTLKALAEGGS